MPRNALPSDEQQLKEFLLSRVNHKKLFPYKHNVTFYVSQDKSDVLVFIIIIKIIILGHCRNTAISSKKKRTHLIKTGFNLGKFCLVCSVFVAADFLKFLYFVLNCLSLTQSVFSSEVTQKQTPGKKQIWMDCFGFIG